MKAFLILIFLIKLIPLKCQIVQGVDLADYPVYRATVSQKVPIKWTTNPFKTKVKAIQDGYTSGVINFAGYYVTVLWERGRDTIQGVMVDSRTGIVYTLPINAVNTVNKCQNIEDVFDRYLFLPNSKLFVTSTCEKFKRANGTKIYQAFYFYLWNEDTKKFRLIKQSSTQR